MRLAYNYSYANMPSIFGSNPGGSGAEVGVHGLFTFAHEISIHTGINGILRLPVQSTRLGFDLTEIALSIPLVVHYNPFMLLPNRTSWEERFFVELGVQADIPISSTDGYYKITSGVDDMPFGLGKRMPVDVGAVVGFVSYLGGGVAIDLRYCFSFTRTFEDAGRSYLNQGSIGLRFYFN
jgi:hypothetical protein